MNINETIFFFENLRLNTIDKSEKYIYENFIAILTDLKSKKLTEEQFQEIEEKLELLNIKASIENRKKEFKRKLANFTTYLKEKFSFISEGYYIAIGMSLGMCFGVAFGAVFDKFFGAPIGISMGMLIGLIVGRIMDAEAEKQGRVLKTRIKK